MTSMLSAKHLNEYKKVKQELLKEIKKRTSYVFPVVIDKKSARYNELHPSSYPFCGLQQAFSEAKKLPPKEFNYLGEYYTSVGTVTHELIQRYMGYKGKVIGFWKCRKCKTLQKNTKPTVSPNNCYKCFHEVFDYEEIGIKYKKYTRGHLDGIIKLNGKYYIIDYKGLALDTPLPTPSGWTTMGKIKVGDQLFDSQGNVCNVTQKSEVHKRNCYKITFDDASTVVCDDEHLWVTYSSYNKKRQVLNTEEIKNTLIYQGQKHHRIPLVPILNLPKIDLPIDPYVLGCWLGDGTSASGYITKPDNKLFRNIKKRGYEIGNNKENREGFCQSINIVGLYKQLRENNLLNNNKHIPEIYLRAGNRQRLKLLQGLLDTDGSWNKVRKQVVFCTTDKKLAKQFRDLACSLGQRAIIHTALAHGFGLDVTAYQVTFVPVNGIKPFKLTRKAELVEHRKNPHSSQRIIVSVEKVKAVKTQCLAVDSPDRTYLCTKSMIATHNTTSVYKNDKHRKFKNVYPYRYNVAQIESYCVYVEKQYGIKISGWFLIYLARDSNVTDMVIEGNIISDEQKEKIAKRLKIYEKQFSRVMKLRKENKQKYWDYLVKTKPCKSMAHYKEVMHSYDMCPLAEKGVCFSSARLKREISNITAKIKIVDEL